MSAPGSNGSSGSLDFESVMKKVRQAIHDTSEKYNLLNHGVDDWRNKLESIANQGAADAYKVINLNLDLDGHYKAM